MILVTLVSTVILLAESEIGTIYVRHRPEKQVGRRTSSYETDFASSIKSADDPSNYDEGWQGLSRLIFLALTLDAYRNTVLTSIHEPLNSVQNRVCSISL
jgi:hypothetical protein